MFINKEDLTRNLHEEYIDEITREDDITVNANIEAAIEEAKSYLATRYDVDSIFSEVGDNRNALLVELISDIAIFNLIELDRPGIDSEDRLARYKRAIAWLRGVNKGDLATTLPLLPDVTAEAVIINSNSKRKNSY